ncbi:MAG: Hsp70 family protein [Planctomycetota bacterium]
MKFLDGHTVGIDLGTSYSAIAHLDQQGNPAFLANANDSPITPSIVVLGDEGRVVVGPTPEVIAREDANRVVVGIKRDVGNPDYERYHEGRRLTPELISSMILMKLRKDAEKHIRPIANAVITVPYYFNEPKRQATRHAGRIAGLNVIDIINEPTAATLAYAWQKGELGNPDLPNQARTILVYDLGGGTFDVTVVQYTPTEFTVLGTDGDTMLGGLDWSRRIAEWLAAEFESQFGLNPLTEPMAEKALLIEAEAAKRDVSLFGQSTIEFEFRGQKLQKELKRSRFEELTLDLLQRTRDTTEFVLDQAKVDPTKLDEVLLIGGSTAMPAVAAMLKTLTGREPSSELNPQTAVAQGAAIHAAILQARHNAGKGVAAESLMRRLRSVTTKDVNSHSLGVEVTDPKNPKRKINHIMIPRNTLLPASTRRRFKTTTSNPRSIHVRLLEGEAPDVSSCTFVGDFRLIGLPKDLPKGSPVELVYGYDDLGHIHVTLKELTGNRAAHVDIAWSHGLDEQAIDALEKLAAGYKVE